MKKDPAIGPTQATLNSTINAFLNQSKRATMKTYLFTLTVMGLMAGTLLTGCDKKTMEQKVEAGKENVGDAKEALQDAQAAYLKEWEAFKKESEEQIDANKKRIHAFKEKMEKAGSKAKAQYKKDVEALEQKNDELKKKLEEYKDEGQSRWEEFKSNFKRDMDGIGKTMKELFKDND
jgi:predicted RNase H-like nuclease (RuvC/YqgF family)